MGRPIRSVLALALGLLACRPDPGATPVVAAGPDPDGEQAGEPAGEQASPDRVEGAAYLWTPHLGLSRVDEGGVHRVVEPLPQWDHGHVARLLVAPGGEVWLGHRDGVLVLDPDGRPRRVAERPPFAPADLAVDAGGHAWSVNATSPWTLTHYDGSSWEQARGQHDFPAGSDMADNHFVGLAATDDGVWLALSGGLWRGSDGRWERIPDPPGELSTLGVYRGRPLVGAREGAFVYAQDGWRTLGSWPTVDGRLLLASSESGALAVSGRAMHVRLRDLADERRDRLVGPLAGSELRDLAVDGAGRTWATTDRELAVIEADGRFAARWPTGALADVAEAIEAIAVVSAGPTRLPEVARPRTRTVVGRVVDHDGRRPLARARVEICSVDTFDEPCPPASRIAETTSRADGSFRLRDVPDGTLVVSAHVTPCGRGQEAWLTTFEGCTGANADPCDVGELVQCPPPPPP